MLTNFPVPVLSITADAVKDLDGYDALSGLWTLFSKCKESLQDGRRLENISWRLWHREFIQAQSNHSLSPTSVCTASGIFQPLTPVSMTPNQLDGSGCSSPTPEGVLPPLLVVEAVADCRPQLSLESLTRLGLPSPDADGYSDRSASTGSSVPPSSATPLALSTSTPAATVRPRLTTSALSAVQARSPHVGRIIVDILPKHLDLPPPRKTLASLAYPQQPPSPAPSQTSRISHPQPKPSTPVFSQSPSSPRTQDTYSVVPSVQLPATPPSTTFAQATTQPVVDTVTHTNMFPRVVVVNPTPRPTPSTTPVVDSTFSNLASAQGMNDTTRPSAYLLPPLPLLGPAQVPVPTPSLPLSAETLQATTSSLPGLSSAEPPGVCSDTASMLGETRRFFLQHSPEDISPDRDHVHRHPDGKSDGDTSSMNDVKSPISEVFEHGKNAELERKGLDSGGPKVGDVMQGGCNVEDGHEDDGEEELDDRAAAGGSGGKREGERRSVSGMVSRMRKSKGKHVPIVARRTHSTRHGTVAPMIQKRSSTQDPRHPHLHHHHQHSHPNQQVHRATFNIGSGSSGASKSTQSTNPRVCGQAQALTRETVAAGLNARLQVQAQTAVATTKNSTKNPSPAPSPSPPAISEETSAGDCNLKPPAGNVETEPKVNTNPSNMGNNNTTANGVVQQQVRKTIVVASTSEEYETTEGSDSDWASDEADVREESNRTNFVDARQQQPEEYPLSKPSGPAKSTSAFKGMMEEDTRLRQAVLEAQRQRDLFAKVPRRSYSNLNRTQSGLLSQLMNPNPAIFPPNHPYRSTRSSQDIPRVGQPFSGPAVTQAQSHVQTEAPTQPTQTRRPPQARVPQRSNSAFAAPLCLSPRKVTALGPMAAPVTAVVSPKASGSGASQASKGPSTVGKSGGSGGYRPKGRPQEAEMEDDSGEENEYDRIPVSKSVAQQKLQALMSRRSASGSRASSEQRPESGLQTRTGVTNALHVQAMGILSSADRAVTPTPIPVGHPYNLPVAAPPMTPRTTRRRMLRTELSESMRRQLLWERQVSSTTNSAAAARRANQQQQQALNGQWQPVTSENTSLGHRADGAADAGANGVNPPTEGRRLLTRNWTWTDDYHFAGW